LHKDADIAQINLCKNKNREINKKEQSSQRKRAKQIQFHRQQCLFICRRSCIYLFLRSARQTPIMAIFVEQSTFISGTPISNRPRDRATKATELPANAADQQFRYNIAYRIIMSSSSSSWPAKWRHHSSSSSNCCNYGSNSCRYGSNIKHGGIFFRTLFECSRLMDDSNISLPAGWRRFLWSSFVCSACFGIAD